MSAAAALAAEPLVGRAAGVAQAVPAGLYEGTVRHRRIEPVEHAFSYRVAMVHLDVERVDEALAVSPLASQGPLRPVRFDRRDHLGDPSVPLAETIRSLVEDRLGFRPAGPVTVLAHLRTWGWCFNPIAIYWCHDERDTDVVVAQVLSVMNTPWKQRHAYVIDPGGPGRNGGRWEAHFDKKLHVSPFMPMDLEYHLTSTTPGRRVSVSLDAARSGRPVFTASLVATRRDLDRGAITRLVTGHPLMTHRVSTAIHLQAAKLWRKRVPVVDHPDGAPLRLRSRRST
ncbi:MAG: DUF1365 domain-containing protein [Acidimicrobiales bacterium]